MGLFDGINVSTSEEVEHVDEQVSSGGKSLTESGYYPMIIKMAYLGQSDTKEPTQQNGFKLGEAVFVRIKMETEDGKELTVTEYITSGKKMVNNVVLAQQAYYEKDGKRYDMPGYAKLKNLNYLLNGVHGEPTNVEEREIKEYDYELKQEVTVKKRVILDFINKPIGVCVSRIRKDRHDDSTKFVETSEASHFCDPVTGHFGTEKLGNKEPALKEKFLETIPEDKIFDKRKNSKNAVASSGTGGSTGASQSAQNFAASF